MVQNNILCVFFLIFYIFSKIFKYPGKIPEICQFSKLSWKITKIPEFREKWKHWYKSKDLDAANVRIIAASKWCRSFCSLPVPYLICKHLCTLSKKKVNFHSICHWRHSLGSDVSDHFFWSEYRVNRMRFHSLSSEFSLYWSWNRVKFTPQWMKFASLHRWSELFTQFFFREYAKIIKLTEKVKRL